MSKTSFKDSIVSFCLRNSFWIKDYLGGSKVRRQYNNVKKIHSKRRSDWQSLRETALKTILNHAVTNTELYKGINPDSLTNFPVVNKQFLIENHNHNLVPTEALPWQIGEYVIQRTSGSTGTPFAVPMDMRKRQRRIGELKYFGEIVGFNSHDKLMQLRIWSKWQKKSLRQQKRENITAWDISDSSESNLQKLYDNLKNNRCSAIRGYASSLDLLAKFVKKHGLSQLPYLKIAIAGSEALYDDTRDLVKKYLGCDIISQYANEENGILAQQTIDGRLADGFELNDSSYFFEVLKLDSDEPAALGELGRIVITDLYNYAFPMIRYANGDCGILAVSDNGEVYLSKIYGRVMDLVYNTRGEPVSPMTLARILKNIDGIQQWQFIQKNKGVYCIKIISSSQPSESLSAKIKSEIIQYFGDDSNLSIEYVSDIPPLKSGKRKSVICESYK